MSFFPHPISHTWTNSLLCSHVCALCPPSPPPAMHVMWDVLSESREGTSICFQRWHDLNTASKEKDAENQAAQPGKQIPHREQTIRLKACHTTPYTGGHSLSASLRQVCLDRDRHFVEGSVPEPKEDNEFRQEALAFGICFWSIYQSLNLRDLYKKSLLLTLKCYSGKGSGLTYWRVCVNASQSARKDVGASHQVSGFQLPAYLVL